MIVSVSTRSTRMRGGIAPRNTRCKADTSVVACASALSTLKKAAKGSKIASPEVFTALREVQKAKLEGSGWGPVIGCDAYWRLVYTAKPETVAKSMRNCEDPLTGAYFPVVATQRFTLEDERKGTVRTGAYIPHLAAMEFKGDAESSGKRLSFDMKELRVKIGPFTLGPFSVPSQVKEGKGPFFNFFYADEDIMCAIGRSGGMAMWAKAEPTYVAQNGISF